MRQDVDEGRFPFSLHSFENQGEVELRAGLVDACHAREEDEFGDRAAVGVIRGAEMADERGFEAFYAVPNR